MHPKYNIYKRYMNIETLISQAAGEAVKALYDMEANEKMLQLPTTVRLLRSST